MNSIKEKKEFLRKEVLEKRIAISEKEWKNKSDQIISSLTELDIFEDSDTVHTYLSMNERREVCTDELIKVLLNSDKKTVVPVTNFSKGVLTHSEITSSSAFKTNKWGVREPKEEKPVDASGLDIIIVPMVAADRKGNRLGYGQGFYDRFLFNINAKAIGLVFEDFLFDEIPSEEFDVKLDVIITEEGVKFA